MTISRIDHVGVTVSDMDRALAFYRDLLGLRVIADATVAGPEVAELLGLEIPVQLRIADLDSGDGRIVELIQYLQPKGRRIAYESSDPASAHIAFTVDDLEAVRERLSDEGATIVSRRPIMAVRLIKAHFVSVCSCSVSLVWFGVISSSRQSISPSKNPCTRVFT